MPNNSHPYTAQPDDKYAPLRGFEHEQAKLASGREADYTVPPEQVTAQTKRQARYDHCLAIPTRGVSKDGVPFLHFGEHQVMQAWERPYMQELAKVATSTLYKGDVLELGYGMGISGGYVQDAIAEWNAYHPHENRTHHISELNLDVAADCMQQNSHAIQSGNLVLHIGDWRDLLTDIPGIVVLLGTPEAEQAIEHWNKREHATNECCHVVTPDPAAALECIQRYKHEIANAHMQVHVGNWPAVMSELRHEAAKPNYLSLLATQTFGGALLDTYALTSDERHFNQIPALHPVRQLLADGGMLTYYGDAEKDYQPSHRQALVAAGFHPDNIGCSIFSFERYTEGTSYKNKYNKLSSMIVPRIVAGPASYTVTKLNTARQHGYLQPESYDYHGLSRQAGLAYAEGWFRGIDIPFTPEDIAILADKVQVLFDHFGGSVPAGRIIEVGSGPNLGNTIAAAPFCKEYIGLERSPQLAALANDWVEGRSAESAAMWQGWREVAGIFYGLTSSGKHALTWLTDLMQTDPEAYNAIRAWNQLPVEHPQKARLLADAHAAQNTTGRTNPYLSVSSFTELTKGKTHYIAADVIDEVDGNIVNGLANIQPFVHTADVVMGNYIHESVNPELIGVAHSMLNAAKLAKPTGLLMNCFMEKTLQYPGFLQPLDECYATAAVFKKLQQQVSVLRDSSVNYIGVVAGESGAAVRAGYAGASVYSGYRALSLPANVYDILHQVGARGHDAVVAFCAKPAPDTTLKPQQQAPNRMGYCVASEADTFAKQLAEEYQRTYGFTPHVAPAPLWQA